MARRPRKRQQTNKISNKTKQRQRQSNKIQKIHSTLHNDATNKPQKLNKMTKQEFLNTPAKTVTDAVCQQILNSESMTSLKQLQRSLKQTYKTLYKDEWKAIPLKDLMSAIEKAAFLIVD